jgi:hypothetical protein
MQTLAFLCFELQVAQQRLRATFAESQVPAKAHNLNSPNRIERRGSASVKPVRRMKSAREPRQLPGYGCTGPIDS